MKSDLTIMEQDCVPSLFRVCVLQAKEMVELSKSIASKIREKQGDITEDEVS